MKNLKKILSLTLALAMALSLMTVAFAKDTGDFADGDDVSYAEAVDVMATIGVFNGTGDGSNFDPKGTLTREQAAKIITYMVMGQTQADKLVATIAPFADVSADRWSAGAIAYCASEGIMNGTGNGKFNPTGELTGLQFAKMLLVALGYDAEIEKMTGAAWGLATSKLAYAVELDDGMDDINLSAPMTREEAAQMALTTMKTPLVRYPDKGSTIEVNGAVVSFGAREAEYVTSEIAKEQTISDQRLSNTKYYTIEFGEKYCPKLVLKSDTDAFGRPSYTWSYDKKDIATYIDQDLLYVEYTAEVTGETLYNDIGSSTLKDANVTVYIDGETDKEINAKLFGKGNIVKSNTKGVGGTGNGTLTQVFIDTSSDEPEITIAIVNTYLAKAAEDYNEKDEDIDLNVYGIGKVANFDKKSPNYLKNVDRTNPYETIAVSNDDINVSEMKEDDIVLVTVAEGEVQSILTPEVVSDATITNFKKDKYVTADGTKYDYTSTAVYDEETLENYELKNMKDLTYNVFLDEYGYAIGVEKNEEPDKYVFVTGIDGNGSNLSTKTADVNVIFLDGTMEVVKVNTKDSDPLTGGAIVNKWYTYTVDKNDVYTLEAVASQLDADNKVKVAQSVQNVASGASAPLEIDKKHVSLAGKDATAGAIKVYGNDDTVYLTVGLSVIGNTANFAAQTTVDDTTANYFTVNGAGTNAAIIDEVESVTVGVKNVSLEVKHVAAADYNDGDGSMQLALPINEIYPLYKDNGYVIAAVVIGDSGGVSKNYAYITGDINREGYDKDEDEWSWSREAVVDGKIVELTEVGSNIKYLDNMSKGNWYEIKYDAKGNVRGYKVVSHTPGDTTANAHEYISEVIDVEKSVEDHDTVILKADYKTTKGYLTYKNGTLYTNKTATEGFSVSPSVKSVVSLSALKADGTVDQFDDVTDGYEGYKDLEKAIRDLDDNFKGELNVLFEDGVATVIIFNDTTGTAVDEGEEEEVKPTAGKYSSEVDSKITTGLDALALDDTDNNKIHTDGKTLKLHTYGGGDMATQIKDALAALGYSDVTMTKTGLKYEIKATKGGVVENLEMTVGTDNTNYWIVDINGTKSYIADNAQPDAIAKGTGDKGTGFAVSTDGGKTWAYDKAYTNKPTAITADTVIKSGYVKVTADALTSITGVTGSTVTYTVDGQTLAAGATTGCAKVDSEIVITVDFKTGKLSTGKADATLTATGYVAAIKTAATLGADTVAETAATASITFPTNGKDYTSGVYTFTKTVEASDMAADLTIPAVTLSNS